MIPMKLALAIIILVLIGFLGYTYLPEIIGSRNVVLPTEEISVPDQAESVNESEPATPQDDRVDLEALRNIPEREVVAENLTIPWDIAFLSEDEMLVTERTGTIARINLSTKAVSEIAAPDVSHRGEGGLLGMVLHPDFETNGYLYLYMTSLREGEGPNASMNQVVRYRLSGNELTDSSVIIGNIPGSLFHDGGRLAFGPDGLLYVTTGDAQVPENAQNLNSLSGKILRVTEDGKVPLNNPFGTLVYAYGSRNAQGLSWDPNKNLWSTEHGRTNATQTGMDEVNLIVPGGNYGWPASEGNTVLPDTRRPKLHSGADATWAPASALYWDGSLFFGGLRGEALYEAVLSGTEVVELKEYFKGEFGRIRTVVLGLDGAFYITTSNRDGRGSVRAGDDKIVRINPLQFRQ
jgi:glucose/arabinose dehydrogenase